MTGDHIHIIKIGFLIIRSHPDVSLVNVMSRELILRTLVEQFRKFYDFIIIDCMPSLGMMTINALACADSVLIPVQAAYLPVKGLQQLIKTISRVRKQLNPKLKIEGILLTMVDNRTNYVKQFIIQDVQECKNYTSEEKPTIPEVKKLHVLKCREDGLHSCL